MWKRPRIPDDCTSASVSMSCPCTATNLGWTMIPESVSHIQCIVQLSNNAIQNSRNFPQCNAAASLHCDLEVLMAVAHEISQAFQCLECLAKLWTVGGIWLDIAKSVAVSGDRREKYRILSKWQATPTALEVFWQSMHLSHLRLKNSGVVWCACILRDSRLGPGLDLVQKCAK